MENEVLVTIRCLVYNHEPFLRQCLNGFLMQKTNFKFEVWVHDDASTDDSPAIIKEYAEKYSNVEYIDLADAFCNDQYCFGSKNNEPLYSDGGHLNLKGSEFTAEFIYPKIKEMLAE